MKNIRLLIEYDGTNYNGWQTQKNANTIHDMLADRIKRITGEEVKLLSASRTDAGVHALGQAASFKTASHLEPQVLKRALNAVLPEDVRILEAGEADMTFHPRYEALGKSYFYIIDNTDTSSAFLYRYAWRLAYRLDINEMKIAAKMLVGRHDFSAFRGSGCGAKNALREISLLEIKPLKGIDFMTAKLEGRFIKIRIEADAFLRHMVRNIVGTLVEVARGRMNPAEFRNAFQSRDRKRTGPTAPAKGLFLEKVRY